ncbi:unnamed protein product [Urochloa humidicola]
MTSDTYAAKRARTGLPDPPPPALSSPLHLYRDWASFTSGPAGLIAERVLSNDVADYVRFRAVCTAWRACSADPRAQGAADRRFHPRRWIMLPSAFNVDKRRRFLNVFTGQCIYVPIPDLRRYYFLGPTAEGLLVLCRKGTHVVNLLNPLTGQVTNLPCATTLLDPNHGYGTMSIAMSYLADSEPRASLADDATVALISGHGTLAVAKPSDEHWRRLHLDDQIMTAFSFGGRLYCATRKNVLLVDTTVSKQPRLVVVARYELKCNYEWYFPFHRMYPVLHADHGDLILVHRYMANDTDKYTAYRVKLDTGSVVPTSGFGGQTLFICRDCSYSVPARVSSSISTDTIYKCQRYDSDRPITAFDLLGTCSDVNFDKKDIAYFLLSYVCSEI